MTIDEIYKIVAYLVDKSQGAYLPPNDFNLALNMSQRQYFDFLAGSVESFQVGRPISRIGWGMGKDVSERLSPFIIRSAPITVTSGVVAKPSTLARILLMTTDAGVEIKRVDEDKMAAWKASLIDPPSISVPYYSEANAGYYILPSSTPTVNLSYLKFPSDVAWVGTGARPVYSSGSSTQLLWRDTEINDIIYRTMGVIGINLAEGAIMQAANVIKQQGE